MIDIKIAIEKARQLNQAWKSISSDLDKDNIPSDLYEALCDIDESVSNIIEKLGEAVKIMVINSTK